MDNKIFNVNGRTKTQLAVAVGLLLLTEYDDTQKVRGWYFNKKKGLVLTWYVGKDYRATPFTNRMGQPSDIDTQELVDLLWKWLKSPEAQEVEAAQWEGSLHDSDVSEENGWRLYSDEWGHVGETEHTIDHYSIAAFKPMKLWYGK
jgi:hypothetical protein